MQYDRSRWAIIRAHYTTLTSTLLVTFQKLLDEGLSPYVKSFNRQTNVVTLTNGSEIIFFAENFDRDKDYNRFRGLEVNGFGIDEINELQKTTLYKCIERAGSWQGSKDCPIKILATCNPAHNWVKDDIYDKWENNILPKGWAYVPSKITDNPHVSKEYIESLKYLPEHQYRMFVEGDWNVQMEGVLFPISELKTYKYIGDVDATLAYIDVADTGEDDHCVIIGKLNGKQIYIDDVLYTKLGTDRNVQLSADIINRNKPEYVRIESNMGGGMYRQLLTPLVNSSTQLLSVRNTTHKHTRITTLSGFIKTFCVFKQDYEINSDYGLFIKNLTNYLADGTSKHDDAPDALQGLVKMYRTIYSNVWDEFTVIGAD
jgi:predicted phage terminase large subunit-like protein